MKKLYFIFFLFLGINTIPAQTNKTYTGSKLSDEMVYTPAGPVNKSKVHLVDKEHHLNVKDGRIQIIETKTGKVSQEFNYVPTENNNQKDKKIMKNLKNNSGEFPYSSGWITFADCSNNFEKPITYFSTNWIVPSPPSTSSNQLIYLFNGMIGKNGDILQPVLQWGVSPAGGGNYWSITNWFVSSYDVFYDSLIEVSPGTNLQGVMKLTSESGNNYSYNSSFTGYPSDNEMQINNISQLYDPSETLEVYGITECSDYPPDMDVKMTGIQIKTDSIYPPWLMWVPIDKITDCGQYTDIINYSSDNGEVDIYFHTPCAGTPYPGSTLTTANTVCPIDAFLLSLQYTIFPDGGLTYQWQSSPDSSTWYNMIGDTNATSYITQTDSTWYRCAVSCSVNIGYSNTIKEEMVKPYLPVSVNIKANANPVYSGTSVTFTASSTNGGTTPYYQWKVNGVNAGTNWSTYTYAPANNDTITCVLKSSYTCAIPQGGTTSNKIIMAVKNILPISLKIEANVNTVCNGNTCNDKVTSVLINEVMIAPLTSDGSIYDVGLGDEGEWIELYNPNLCKPLDVSCYYLGSNAYDYAQNGYGNYGAGFRIPPNTIIPARGFLIIRGINAPTVPDSLLIQNGGSTIELIADNSLNNICIDGRRLALTDAGGWIALYDKNGVPQDAVGWSTPLNKSCFTCVPCFALCYGCTDIPTLASFDSIPENFKYFFTTETTQGTNFGKSWGRIPDGGAWSDTSLTPTMGTCNFTCIPAPVITCNGKAWVTASGGVPPYTYKWNDIDGTTKDTVKGLCAGKYTVTVIDSINNVDTMSIQINNLREAVKVNPDHADICKDSTLTLNVTGANTYTWSPSTGLSSTTGSPVSANPDANVVYTVTGTDINGCVNKDSIVITVNPIPVVIISPAFKDICFGDTVHLFASGTSSYSWSPTTGLNTSTGNFVIAKPDTGSNKYIVKGKDNSGCSDTASANIIVKPLPATPTISLNENEQLVSNAAKGNQWYDQDGLITGATSPIYSPIQNGKYYVIVTQNPCQSDTSNIINYVYTGIINFSKVSNFGKVSIYPNPVTNELIIETTCNSLFNIALTNIVGQTIFAIYDLRFTNYKINMSNLANCMYLIKISNEKGSVVRKIIKE